MSATPTITNASIASAVVPTDSAEGTKTIELHIMIPGTFGFHIDIALDAPIPTLLEAIQSHMISKRITREWTAHTTQQNDTWLFIGSPEFREIWHRGSLKASITYCTEATRLDSTNTVAEYFGHAPDRVVHVMLRLSLAAVAQYNSNISISQALLHERLYPQHEAKRKTTETITRPWWHPLASVVTTLMSTEENHVKQD